MAVPAIIRRFYETRASGLAAVCQREDNRQTVHVVGLGPKHRIGQRIQISEESLDYWAPTDRGG